MERGKATGHFILTEHEKHTAVRALRERGSAELADALEETSMSREIPFSALNSIAEHVGALATREDWGAVHFMNEYRRVDSV